MTEIDGSGEGGSTDRTPLEGARADIGSEEPIKPVRSRRGCFECRKRKVKCDERRPLCKLCEKGDREVYYF